MFKSRSRYLGLALILLLTVVLAGCGSGGGGGVDSSGGSTSGGGENTDGITKTVIVTDDDGNTYEVTADKNIADNITLTSDPDSSLSNVYSSDQTPLLTNFQKLNIPTTQESTSVEVKITYSTPPDSFFVHNKLTGDIEYKPFYNAPDGSTSIQFDTNDNISFMPIQDATVSKGLAAKAVTQAPLPRSLDIVKNNGNLLELKIGTNLSVSAYTLRFLNNNAVCKYNAICLKGVVDQTTNLVIDVSPSAIVSGVYILELRDDSNRLVWKQQILIQKPSDLSGSTLSTGDIAILANKFAPILAYNDDEKFYPSSLEYIFNENEPSLLLGASFAILHDTFGGLKLKYSDAKKYMPYNGHAGSLLDITISSPGTVFLKNRLSERTGSSEDATVYYSFLKDPDSKRFYLNYHMLYSYDPKGGVLSLSNIAAHAFDRESMTLVFDGPIYINNPTPVKVVFGAHLENQSIVLLDVGKWSSSYYGGRVSVLWKNVYKYPADSNQGNPIVAVAKGSHALYPVCGYYEVITQFGSLKENACGGKDFADTASWKRVLTPRRDYKLKSLGLEHITSAGTNGYLAFSGKWIDGLGENDANFPPFTTREINPQSWVNGADEWDNNKYPQYSQDLMAELKDYLDLQQPVETWPPTIPQGLVATAASSSQIDLSWNASSDNSGGVAGYNIYRYGSVVAPSTTTTHSDTGLSPSTQYCYTVSALDAAGNESGLSAQSCATTNAPPPTPQTWVKTYGGSSSDHASSIQQTSDGGYIVAGVTMPFAAWSQDAWVLKLSSDGTVVWQKAYGGGTADSARSIQQTSDGGYIVAGHTGSNALVLKLNSDGTVAWQKRYGGGDIAHSIQQTSDGGYIMAGWTGSHDAWILKLNSDGTVVWQKIYGGGANEAAYSIQQTSDGGYIVSGSTGLSVADAWVLKLNADGTVAWQKRYGGSSYDSATSIQQTSDGGYILVGYTMSFAAGSYDVWILKLGSDGTVAWQKAYGGGGSDRAYSIQQTSDGGYIVAGLTGSDAWVLKLSSDGTVVWQKAYGGGDSDTVIPIQQTSDGGYIVAGHTGSFGGSDAWVLKVDSNGDIGGTCALVNTTSVTPVDTTVIGIDTNITPVDTTVSAVDITLTESDTYTTGVAQCTGSIVLDFTMQ